MSALPVILVIVSTFMHAAWNILARRGRAEQTCIWRMQILIVVAGAVPACIGLAVLKCISAKAGLCLIGSGISCGLYYVCLARGYESGDFTVVYPAARALPVLLVALGDALRGRAPSPIGWVGMLLVAAGCFLVPLTSFSDLRLRHYLKPASLWILLTAFGTVGYSLFDKVGTESIPRGPLESAIYCYLFFAGAAASYYPLRALIAGPWPEAARVGWRVPALAALLNFMAYWLVLWAFQMVERASYIVAFRQFSIVIGVLMAFVVFDEPGKAVRFAGSVVITCGLILLKVFGS